MQSCVLEATNVPKIKFVANVPRSVPVPCWNTSCEIGQHFKLNSTTGELTYEGNKSSVSIQLAVASGPQNADINYCMLVSGHPTSTLLIAPASSQGTVQSGFVVCSLNKNDTLQIGASSNNPVDTGYLDLKLLISPLS
jgi:hypothetical protein